MGLLDSFVGQVLGSMSGARSDRQSGLIDVIGALLNNPQTGGLPGLIAAFEKQGLGGVVSSWIGTGQNQPIGADQLQAVLGSDQLSAMAQQLGFSTQETSGHLAELLPQVIDKLTPNGRLPDNDVLGSLQNSLKDFT